LASEDSGAGQVNIGPNLDRLCAHYGIAAGFQDVHGGTRRASDATRRALLRAMGVPSGDAETERQSFEQAIDREWVRILPPVTVVREDAQALGLSLALPEDRDLAPVRWVLKEEDGPVRDGSFDLASLTVADRRLVHGRPWTLRFLSLPPPRCTGYHRLELFSEREAKPFASTSVILVPCCCYLPEGVSGERRSWGLTTQLHAVRSARNWGIGDFTDLTRLVELTAEAGGGVVALSPLHALFPGRPERCNPYSPSSRAFLNILHTDIEAIPELDECEEIRSEIAREDFQALLRAVRSSPLVDYPAVAKVKLDVLARLYRCFRERHLEQGSERADAFHAFREEQGEPLRRFTLFEALSEHLEATLAASLSFDDWPEPYRRLDSTEVADFAAEHATYIDFHAWLQWQAHQQLQAVGRRSLELRLALGLCADVAAGAAPDGADVWAQRDLYIQGAWIGTPPDEFNPKGQNRRVLAWHPVALREAAYVPFIEALRANMRNAGALRIEQVTGLKRLYLIPAGMDPDAGAYLSYPFEDLLGILALESLRNQCLIIGEDPGSVPDAVREVLAESGIFSLGCLYFERDEVGGFRQPSDFEPRAVVSASTHHLPTLTGFWGGCDLEQRRRLGLFAEEREYDKQLLRRSNDRTHLFLALDRARLLPEDHGVDPIAVSELTPKHICAVYVYLARTPSRLLLIQTADLLGEEDQVSLPGSGNAYPNWRHRQPLEIESWADQPPIADLFAAVRRERGGSARPAPVFGEAERAGTGGASIPRATYRLQLHAGFGFAAASELVPYLARLGISHCYFSPYLKARPGSTHGYDVIAHDRLNPELGSCEDFEHLCDTLAAHGMGQILDMVPNHVGVMGAQNNRWLDVLENGCASRYADFFDIDWEPLREELRGKVLLPVLGDHYGNVLDRGELVLVFAKDTFRVEYYEHHFPIDPREYPRILAPGLDRLRERLGEENEDLLAFESLVTAFANLPPRWQLDEDALTERRRDKEIHKQRLAELCGRNADLRWYVQECLRDFNGAEDYPADSARLHALLEAQAYRVAHWRVATDEINYRRFFDINDLAALRMENAEAFEATHRLVLGLVAEGRLAGLRIDHPDGLYNPAEYFAWVQQRVTSRTLQSPGEVNPAPENGGERPLYLIVEKILVGDEQLPATWPVHGTTGYDFAALADTLLVDPRGEAPLDRCYRDFAGEVRTLAGEIYAAKRLVMRNLLSSELHVLASELSRIAESDPHTRDYTLDALRDTLSEVVACFPVYRTYISAGGVFSRDRNQVLKAVSEARRRSQAPDLSVFGFVQDVLLTDIAKGKPDDYRERVLGLAMKFQQYTGPVTAKGVEDTAFYRYHRLVSLNEVGGDPERFGISVETFHRANDRRRETWPHAMLAGSTHDNKRSEDVRARLHVLSELPQEWQEHVERWALLHRRFRRDTDEGSWPDANTEYLLYQTLLGAWPPELTAGGLAGGALDAFRERIVGYMQKAVREAKIHTAWTNENAVYETALVAFIEAMLDPERNGIFFEDFLPFQRRAAHLGLFNSLSATLLRLTAPGIPDIYQGSELWSFSLVDPDNRRPVDFALRQSLLNSLDEPTTGGTRLDLVRKLLENLPDGRAKLYLIRQALELRRTSPDLFEHGDYRPLPVEGTHAERLCAYARTHAGEWVIAVAPRLLASLVPPEAEAGDPFADAGWSSTFLEVPVPVLRDLLSGLTLHASPSGDRYTLSLAEVLRAFPVGLLFSEGTSQGRS
jgi:(1->4)-alpha-D-glucan 1-alpha-D-glucosylmutase